MDCEYCKVDAEPFINFSSKGDLRIRAYGFISGDSTDDRVLSVSLDSYGFEFAVKDIKIHYCPMCGRKLKDDEIEEVNKC